MAYVYTHTRLDNNEIFYIGVCITDSTKKNRSLIKYGRNDIWNKIIRKTKYSVVIVKNNLSIKEAFSLEKELIALHKRKKDGGTLANITLGGEGVLGLKFTPWNKGKTGLKGKKGHKHTEEFKRKCKERQLLRIRLHGHALAGKSPSLESREKMRLSKLGIKQSEKQRSAISNSRTRTKIAKIRAGKIIETFTSIREAGNKTGLGCGNVSQIINGKRIMPKRFDYELQRI